MNLLVLGSGGREHALCESLLKNNQVYVYPGNEGIFLNESILRTDIESNEFQKILEFCQNTKIDLVVVGPENLLADGVCDYLRENNINVFGPSKKAALLESSKIFSKELMKEALIPTADFTIAETYEEAVLFIESNQFPIEDGIVLKADGLAAGKGVVVTFDKEEALKTVFDFMKNDKISVKTSRLLIEKCLNGKELSAFAICDGSDYIFLGTACDYKRLHDNDEGPNTGGMGCYTPKSWPGEHVENIIKSQVIEPVLKSLKSNGTPFIGTLFCGLMIDENNKVNVIEFNVRFGDPETQTILPLIDGDLSKIFLSASLGNLSEVKNSFRLKDEYSVHLVKASAGYPSIDGTPMVLGKKITNNLSCDEKTKLFYAGVKKSDQGLVNSGGRVLGVTALGDSIESARAMAYKNLKKITFEGEHFRNDIASKL